MPCRAAITPGPVRDRKHFRVALSRNPLVTGAMFEMFLGQNPLDPHGKQMVGNSLLWCANGFRWARGLATTLLSGWRAGLQGA